MNGWRKAAVAGVTTFLVASLALGFTTVFLYATVTPLRESIQDFAVCRGADEVQRQDTRSTQRRTTAGGYRDTGATTTDLTCRYGDDEKVVRNDAAFLRGGTYALVGAVVLAAALSIVIGVSRALARP